MNLEEEFEEIKDKAIELRNENSWLLYNKAVYEFIRKEKPGLVAEAGVAGGATTYCILKAMEKNGKGELWSFDPGHEYVEDESHIGLDDAEYKEHPPGYLVPDHLKDRWNFNQSKFVEGEETIKNVAVEGNGFDVFFHDSDHSDENINAEFEMMKKYVKENGYFLIHDPPTDKVWDEFELVEANNIEYGDGLVSKEEGLTKNMMKLGNNKWALKVFQRED